MTGTCLVRKLNRTGNFLSCLDNDKSFIDRTNPEGLFKMLVQPILNSHGEQEIRFMKTKDGYLVSGEAYILTGADESEINLKARRHREKWDKLVYTSCASENDLW